jgi:hypothetical protein
MSEDKEQLRADLSAVLNEKWQSFDGITDQIERSADLVKRLGGLEALTEFDRARIADMIETQVGLGIARGDFDFVFRRPAPIPVPEFLIARLDVKPGDTIVFKSAHELTELAIAKIHLMADEFFTGHKILVLPNNIEMQILTGGAS